MVWCPNPFYKLSLTAFTYLGNKMIGKWYPELLWFCLLSLSKKKTREVLRRRDKKEKGKKGWEDKRIEEVIFSCANIISRQKAPQQH